ncbi:class I SAM-dependent methyltransferase [Nocardioides ferulae]|uniref:class I SAM-dependent methyltransferase n=1 Tax=Nocardioides ferulae TaxID=2340821 RepID=UPI000EB5C602|nr:class I SAM-dependent methyltransferase [Nocardioides ferulae]
MSEQHPVPARAFGAVADAYDRGRPSYPAEAAAWLTGRSPLTVLELGAGTGKLTRSLVELGHDVHATDPDPAMLEILTRDLPGVRTSVSSAEDIPAGDRSFDVVVAAQSFHWFDHARALPEIARVLKPGGALSLVWNQRDTRIPWVRRLGAVVGQQDLRDDPAEPLVVSGLFGFVEDASFRTWQTVTRDTIADLALSRSHVAVLDEEGRADVLARTVQFYDEYGRGMDGMQLPYLVRCYRARVVDLPEPEGLQIERQRPHDPAIEPPTDGDSGLLLIDFR